MLCDQNAAAADRYKPSDICAMRAPAHAEDGDVYVYAFDLDLNSAYEGGKWGFLLLREILKRERTRVSQISFTVNMTQLGIPNNLLLI